VLDKDPILCSKYHVDKHVVKMILETTQLLNNAMALTDTAYTPVYKVTYVNHPASVWARQTAGNFLWLYRLGKQLCHEYTYRYHKQHKCQKIIDITIGYRHFKNRDTSMTPFAQCMPDYCKCIDAIKAYRKYYVYEKKHIAKWTGREKPPWWIDT